MKDVIHDLNEDRLAEEIMIMNLGDSFMSER
jgi:hypothetical protein